MLVSRIKLEASICRDSFYDFVQRFWHVVVPEIPVWNWHIEAICQILQEAAERVFRGETNPHDIVINVPPGTTKSTIASVLFPAWIWTKFPTGRSLCASYSNLLALDLSRKSRDVIRSDKWKELFGELALRDDQDAKGYFANEKGGMRYAVGTGGSVTGFHGHFLIIDDPIDPNRAISELDLATANRWVAETLGSRKVNKETTVTILIMQRLHQNDPSAVMLARREQGINIKHVKFPAEIQGNGLDTVRPRKYAKCYKDKLLDPVRLPRKVLDEMRVTLGQFGYSGQMLQDPVPLGGGMFQTDKIRIEEPPPLREFRAITRAWDKAGTQDGGAFTAGVKMGQDKKGRFWIMDSKTGQWDSAKREDVIKQTAQIDTKIVVIVVEQEPGSGGKESAQSTVRNLAGFRVRVQKPTGDKVLRADPFSVQVNGENVYMVAGPWNKKYIDELKYFPNSTYKDQTDASSSAFTDLTSAKVRVGAV